MSGPTISDFGEVISSALSTGQPKSASHELVNSNSLMFGQVQKIYTIDDTENSSASNTASYTVYDVDVTRTDGSTEVVRRCRLLQPSFGGGINNFFEVLQSDPGTQAKSSVSMNIKRGHYVLVGFINSRKDIPVILGTLPHNSPVAVKRRPKKGKGTYLEGEVQGFGFIIDNDGALKLTFNGPRDDKGVLVNQNGPTTITVDKVGSITVETNAQQKVHIYRVAKKIRVDNGSTYIDMDQDANKIQVVAKIVETGTGGLQPQVVGNDWKKIMERLIVAIENIVVPTGVGPSGNPINKAEFEGIKADLKEALSKNHTVEK